jgi:mRNA deadenylase 3'-5' endonuclease subunit Ccr4
MSIRESKLENEAENNNLVFEISIITNNMNCNEYVCRSFFNQTRKRCL